MGQPDRSRRQLGDPQSPGALAGGEDLLGWRMAASCRGSPREPSCAARRGKKLTRPTRRSDRKVLYFVDTYANYFDPQLGEALVAVFEHNGIAVYVHPEQAAVGHGDDLDGRVEAARRLAATNIPLLAEAVRQGYHIVASEPSTALCLTHEYLHLIDDDDARLVAANTQRSLQLSLEAASTRQAASSISSRSTPSLAIIRLAISSAGVGTPGENLLRLISGLQVFRVEKGCSGMAGTYGLKRENFRTSLRAGGD